MTLRQLISGLIIAIQLLGCTPQVEKRTYTQPEQVVGPKNQDSPIVILNNSEKLQNSLTWQGTEKSSTYFNLTKDLKILGSENANSDLIKFSSYLFRTFYTTKMSSTSVALENSPYIEAAIGETEKDVQNEMAFYNRFLGKEKKAIVDYVTQFGNEYAWPTSASKPSAAFNEAIVFLRKLNRGFATSSIDPVISGTVRSAISKNEIPELAKMLLFLEELNKIPTVAEALDHILKFARLMKVDIDAENMNQIHTGRLIGAAIENAKTEQDALGVLIEIWRLLTPEQRKDEFGKVSMDLYNFLNGKDEKDLYCLKTDNCNKFFVDLAKSWKIFPELRKYGVQKLKAELQTAVKTYAEAKVTTQILNYLPEIPGKVIDAILSEIAKNEAILNKISNNYPAFVKEHVRAWGKKAFKFRENLVPGVESSEIEVSMDQQKIKLKATSEKSVRTGSAALGTSMSRAAMEIESNFSQDPDYSRVLIMQQLNKLLVLGGFKKNESELFPSFAVPVSLQPNSKIIGFYVKDLGKYDYINAVPDSIVLKDSFSADQKTEVQSSVSVNSQAELLIGISSMIGILKDWEETSFDSLLGKMKVADLITDAPTEIMEKRLFPKEMLLALSIGNAASILKNMTLRGSPLAMIADDHSLIWGNEIATSKAKSTMAVMVDIVEGEKQMNVEAISLSRYLYAISQFYELSAELEKTRSPLLVQKQDDSASAIDQIADARSQLKLLILGMSNFISSQMLSDSSGVASTVNLSKLGTSRAQSNGPKNLETQIATIEALLSSSKTLDMEIYKWAAIDIYYFMNKNLWNPQLSFYQVSIDKAEMPSFPVVVRTLKVLNQLWPYLPQSGQKQATELIKQWQDVVNQKISGQNAPTSTKSK